MLAEDNELNREVAIELLSATGAQIDHASDGLQCVEIFSRSPDNYYDLILMDIQMPVMNGHFSKPLDILAINSELSQIIPLSFFYFPTTLL